MRIDKYLASHGYCSRRKVEQFLQQHKVTLNHQPITQPGIRFNPNQDTLTIDGQSVQQEELVYYLVNKPMGYVSTVADERHRPTVLELLPKAVTKQYRVFPVGRLDIDSTGLVLLTNDGDLAYRLTHPKFRVGKTYQLTVAGKVKPQYLDKIRQGIQLKHYKTAPAKVKKISVTDSQTTLALTLFEGRNREIRRMCKALNLELITLHRVGLGSLSLADLPLKAARSLTAAEISSLKSAQ